MTFVLGCGTSQEALMRCAWIRVLCCIGMLTACSEQPPKRSKEEIELLDAVNYAFSGIEDNTKDESSLTPWQRTEKNKSVEYLKLGRNGIGTSDEETNRKIRNSSFVRYVERISLPEPCVFRFESITEFSKGESQEDFSAYSMTNDLNGYTFNLANAHMFDLQTDNSGWSRPILVMQGPRVVCSVLGGCENAWNSQFSGLELGRFRGNKEEDARRARAVALIKKACPGKAF